MRTKLVTHKRASLQPLNPMMTVAGCLMWNEVYDNSRMYFQCPCVDGLVCQANGRIDIPLGDMGMSCILQCSVDTHTVCVCGRVRPYVPTLAFGGAELGLGMEGGGGGKAWKEA